MSSRRQLARLADAWAVVLLSAGAPLAVAAQSPGASVAPPLAAAATPALTDFNAPLLGAVGVPRAGRPVTAGLALERAGIVAVATAVVMPFDARLAHAIRSPALQSSGFLHGAAAVANASSQPGVVITSALLYGAGRLSDEPRLTAAGLHAGEAIVIASTATTLLKVAAGRQRPFVDETTPYRFSAFGGRHSAHMSFPSGHATAAFAFASAVSADLRRWHPDEARLAAPLLYAGATTVALARMYDDRHWASDVVAGGGIGALVGALVVAHARRDPDNRVDRALGARRRAPGPEPVVMLLRVAW